MESKRIDKSDAIEEIVLKIEDGGEESIEKGMVISLSKLEDETSDMSIRFCNLDMEEVNNIMYGLSLFLEGKV